MNFDKKLNSTKRPDLTSGTVLACSFKDSSSILSPVIEIKNTGDGVPLYNYAYIEVFDRYYYIDDIAANNGTWLLALHCDVLATYRQDILSSAQYVARSASDYDSTIADSLYLTKAYGQLDEFAINYYTNAQYGNDYVRVLRSSGSTGTEKFFNVAFTSGCFLVGIVGNNTAGVTYYAFTNRAFQEFINTAMTFTPSDMSDVSSGVANAIFNPIQYITSVRWFPVSPFYTTTTTSIKIGGYTLPTLTYGGYAMSVDQIDRFYVPIDLPKHPQSSTRPSLNLSPFTELNLVFQPFGCIPLDTTKLLNVTGINCEIVVDYCGGSCTFNVYRAGQTVWTPSGLLYTVSLDYGVQLPISSLIMDWKAGLAVSAMSWVKNALPNVTNAINNLASGQGISTNDEPAYEDDNAWSYLPEYARNRLRSRSRAKAQEQISSSSNTNAMDSAMDLTASALGQLSTVGAVGSFLAFMQGRPYVMAWFKNTVQEDIAKFGRPLYQRRSLDLISGYCLCLNASIDFMYKHPTTDEHTAILAFMNSGFFLE